MDWDLAPGDKIVRKDLHKKFGGRPQGGIGPSTLSPNVLLFTDPLAGHQYGYLDGWDGDRYHYYGEGRFGDQKMASGNAAILRHAEENRTLRLFQGARGEVTYSGLWELDDDEPFYATDAPDFDGQIRKVIVFKLVRGEEGALIPGYTTTSDADETVVEVVSVEEQHAESAFVNPSGKTYIADLIEKKLVLALRDHLVTSGHSVGRLKILPQGEAKPLFSDLWDETASFLVEAKGSVARESVRMAIGQLFDYSRFQPNAAKVVLLPEKPRLDLLSLAQSVDVTVIWPVKGGYSGSPGLPWS
jgi:hypothetical protein